MAQIKFTADVSGVYSELNKLKSTLSSERIGVSVDTSEATKAIGNVKAELAELEQQAKNGGKHIEIFPSDEAREATKIIDTENKSLIKTVETTRTLNEETGRYETTQVKVTENYDKQVREQEKAEKEARKLSEAQAKLIKQQEDAMWDEYNKELEDRAKIESQVTEGLSKHAEEQAKLDAQIENSTQKEADYWDGVLESEQKAFETAQKTLPSLEKQYADLDRQIESYKDNYAAGTFDDVQNSVKNTRDELAGLNQAYADGTITEKQYTERVNQASEALGTQKKNVSQLRTDTEKLHKETKLLGDSLGNIVAKIVAWQTINAAVASVIRSFREAVETMKEVDTELTNIQKVTDMSAAEIEKVGDRAYEVASAYGVAVEDYLESVATMAKAGFENSEAMAELATKTQLVGDVTADVADQFLISANAAYKMGGDVEELSEVLDAANIIENNFATSIDKIAAGFPKVANVASMANMSVNELVAALGTITAVTTESGESAATALRALILNIMSDTETELEDGVTWTKEEIQSLNDALWIYAEDVMKAAEASGELVDPMEAVAALSEAYKEGVLTAADLAELESSLGGKLRTNQLDALIKNYDMYLEMLQMTGEAAGSADAEVDTMLSSWESKTEILKNTWTEFIADLINTDAIKALLDVATGFINLLDSGVGQVIIKTGLLVGAFAAVKKIFAGTNIAAFFGRLINDVTSLTGAVDLLNTSLFASPLFWVAAGGLVIFGLAKVIDATTDSVDELVDSISTYDQEIETLQSEVDGYEEKVGTLSSQEEAYVKILEAEIEAKKELQRLDAQKLVDKAGFNANAANTVKAYNDSTDYVPTDADDYDKWVSGRAEMVLALKDYIDQVDAAVAAGAVLSDETQETYNAAKQAIGEYADAAEDSADATTDVGDAAEETASKLGDVIGVLDDLSGKLSVAQDAFDDFNDDGSISYSTLSDIYEKFGDLDNIDDYIARLTDAELTADDLSQIMGEMTADLVLNKLATGELTAEDEALIAAMLKEAGVAESAAAAHNLVAVAAANDANATFSVRDQIVRLANTSINPSGITNAFAQIANSANSAANAVYLLRSTIGNATKTSNLITDIAEQASSKTTSKKITTTQLENLKTAMKAVGMSSKEASTLYNAVEYASKSGTAITTAQVKQLKLIAGNYLSQVTDSANAGYQSYLDEVANLYSAADWYTGGGAGLDDDDTSGSSSSGSSSSGTTDYVLEAWKDRIALLKSELDLMEERGDSEDDIIAKQREIQAALKGEAAYLEYIGGEQTDINDLYTEWWQIENELLDDQEEKAQKLLDIEEAKADVLQKQVDLLDAQNERTVRIWNASTGQWEWGANASSVKSAKEALESAVTSYADAGGTEAAILSPGAMTAANAILGAATSVTGTNTSSSVNYNGNTYSLGGVTLTEGQAKSTTVYELCQLAQGLTIRNEV